MYFEVIQLVQQIIWIVCFFLQCPTVVSGCDWCIFITETARTAQGKPCANDSKTPYQGRCLRSLCRQLLEVRSLLEKRKYRVKDFALNGM